MVSIHDFPSGRHLLVKVECTRENSFVDRNRITCYECGELGHRKSECRTWKTKLCKPQCCPSLSTNCAFAHGEDELREPWLYIKKGRFKKCEVIPSEN